MFNLWKIKNKWLRTIVAWVVVTAIIVIAFPLLFVAHISIEVAGGIRFGFMEFKFYANDFLKDPYLAKLLKGQDK